MDYASLDGIFTSYKTLKEVEIRLLNLQPRCNRLAPMMLESSQLDGLSVEIECSFSLTNLDDPLHSRPFRIPRELGCTHSREDKWQVG
jgi:hypothetical protein